MEGPECLLFQNYATITQIREANESPSFPFSKMAAMRIIYKMADILKKFCLPFGYTVEYYTILFFPLTVGLVSPLPTYHDR